MSNNATKTGVLITNLGTPDEPTSKAVSTYLSEFLSDKRVVELPAVFWKPLLKLLVIPLRAKRVAESYGSIWLDDGAPLLVYTQRFAEGLKQHFNNPDLVFDVAMRYGNPSMSSVLDKMMQQGCERVIICPMYPQYCAATTATCFDEAARFNRKKRNQIEMLMPKRYAADPHYIAALERSVRSHWDAHGKPDLLLLSYHGMPQAAIDKGDPYQQDCLLTSRLLAEALADTGVPTKVSFQSQFGKAKWIGPSTHDTLQELAKQDIGTLDVICPGFSVDCLETLEEISEDEKSQYQEAGGGDLRYIPCLNSEPHWVEAYAKILTEKYPGVFSQGALEN